MFIGTITSDDKPLSRHEVIIKLKNISKVYNLGSRKVHALTDFSMDVRSRDFIVVCGPSGCGKSTLLNIMTGAEQTSTGSVVVRGENISSMSEDQRGVFRSKKMGVIYQRPHWIRSLSSIQNVALPLIIEGVNEKRAVERASDILLQIGLSKLADHRPDQLSGGEQQKLAFARAVITNPHIIIADEPTGNLDSTSSDELMALFHGLHADMKKTIIIVTHNQAYWSLGTKRVEMRDGTVIKEVTHG